MLSLPLLTLTVLVAQLVPIALLTMFEILVLSPLGLLVTSAGIVDGVFGAGADRRIELGAGEHQQADIDRRRHDHQKDQGIDRKLDRRNPGILLRPQKLKQCARHRLTAPG